jgi:hypothetical protein
MCQIKDEDIHITDVEYNIEFKLDDVEWIKCLEFLIQSLCVPKEYWE